MSRREPLDSRTGLAQYFHMRLALRATVLLAVGGMIVTALSGVAASAGTAPHDRVPVISPTAQSERALSRGFPLPQRVGIVADHADPAALAQVEASLKGAGVAYIEGNTGPVTIYVGNGPAASAALDQLGVAGPTGLPAEGYVLAVGVGKNQRKLVVLDGIDATGTYYAAQSFRQIVGRWLPGVVVRDWPGFGFRGVMESFYGPEWSQADRLSQIDFLAAHKMDTFFYGAAGDPRTGTTWDSPYGADELGRMQQVVQAAQQRHINFIYRISPEAPVAPQNGICHSSDTDRAKLLARFQQLWDIGVRQFVIAWDDVSGHFTCARDQQVYGSDPVPSAAAQTSVVNYIQQQFIDTHVGAKPLIAVPTQYAGDQTSAYRTRFDDLLTPKAHIYWTGPQVVSTTIKVSDITATQQAFPKHQLVIWDNYPVNDYATDRLLLGPLVGRAAGLERHALGITFNELQEEEPSKIVLFTEADYAWNPEAYNAGAAWDRGLGELGGRSYPALRTFAENNYSSNLDPRESLTLTPLLSTFDTAYANGRHLQPAALRLDAAFRRLQSAPDQLRAHWDNQLFLTEAKPWLTKLGIYGRAGQIAVDLLLAQRRGDGPRAWSDRLAL
ncbi:MAG: beta-N-acetylglucosaminidase domain-containing protein, partial [Actinomycetota bacterium]|nr:beta-N-acetylglucosaminidase domain-containing protein [Actinomycetota bacterium]